MLQLLVELFAPSFIKFEKKLRIYASPPNPFYGIEARWDVDP